MQAGFALDCDLPKFKVRLRFFLKKIFSILLHFLPKLRLAPASIPPAIFFLSPAVFVPRQFRRLSTRHTPPCFLLSCLASIPDHALLFKPFSRGGFFVARWQLCYAICILPMLRALLVAGERQKTWARKEFAGAEKQKSVAQKLVTQARKERVASIGRNASKMPLFCVLWQKVKIGSGKK